MTYLPVFSRYFTPAFILLLFLNISSVLAQQENSADRESSRKADHARKASHYYEVLIKDVLTKYYDERTFLVDANVFLKDIKSGPSSEDFSGIRALPGLPILPDELRTDLPPGTYDGGKREYGIKYVDLEILADTSYNARDIEFIQKMVSMAANLNEYRGDRLKIKSGIFPVKKKKGAGYVLAEKYGSEDLDGEEGPGDRSLGSRNPFQPYVENLASLIPLLIICLFILLIVWIVTKAMGGKKKGKDEDSYTTILNEINQLKNSIPAGPATPNGGDTETTELSELKSFLLSSFIGDTKGSTQIFKNWIANDKEKGRQDAGRLIKAVDDRLITIITPELSGEMARDLENEVKNMDEISMEETLPVLKEFKSDFQKGASFIVNEDEYKDLFGFLKQLNEQQILHLIKEESEGIIGMLLAQLDPEKASRIIQKIDKSKRTKILAGMGKIENISIKAYKELADRISSKALEVIKMRYVTSDGVSSVLEVLDNLPLNVQDDYLNSLAETDIHLAEKIRSIFITLPEVAELPDKFLGTIMRSLDQDTLVLCLVSAEENLQDKVIQLLPERMQMMVKSGMESRADASPEEIETAQKKLLQKIRQEIKAAGGRPE
ncbi:FliG C-terminal domain-containing protein [Fibrobacterota bacterium]